MIITPIILNQIPNPSPSDCSTLLLYTNSVISNLETVLDRLSEVSSNPDETIILIREKVGVMLSEAKRIRENLNSIEIEAINRTSIYNQDQTVV